MSAHDASNPPTAAPALAVPRRADALDALRGFAILTMALSGLIPFGVLPPWMYHAQIPPPAHKFDPNLPGLTWVDLVFPFFLFALGASIPLALARRIEKGERWWQLLGHIAKRGVLLGGFAIYDQHIRPYTMQAEPTARTWLLALLGFALLFPILARLPAAWSQRRQWAVRGFGWVGAIVLMASLRFGNDQPFSVNRSDIIIVVLTNVAVFGSLLWLVTRRNWLLRLGILGILIAVRLAKDSAGWVHAVWDYSPAPWIYKLYYLQYLFIVLPGTLVGDMLLEWMHAPTESRTAERPRSPVRLAGIAALMVAIIALLLAGLQGRWLPWTTVMAVGLCAAGWALFAQPADAQERLLRRFFAWSAYWLVLGLVFEPYEGGIKKDHPTLSYYFVTTGLAIFALIAFTIVIEMLGKRRWLRLLIDNGQNPMIAYAGINNLLVPVLALTGIAGWVSAWRLTPWPGFGWGCVKVLLLALAVSLCTRRKVFWRT